MPERSAEIELPESDTEFSVIEEDDEQDNPRRLELQARGEKNLSKEELAELWGLNAFPGNPRGALLRKKEELGTINDLEKEELRRLYQLKMRKRNSPAVQGLWERVEANDPNVEVVEMDQGKSIEVGPSDEEKVIWTYGLLGCYCTIVFTESEDGTRDCIMTHYPPTNLSGNMARLGELIDSSDKMKSANAKKAVIALKIQFVQDPNQSGKYQEKESYESDTRPLEIAIKAKLGPDVDFKIQPYPGMLGPKDQGIVVVYVPPKGRGDVWCRSWIGSEKLSQ